MNYLKEIQDKNLVYKLIQAIKKCNPGNRKINFMEVCGTHTQSFFQNGLKSLLPDNLWLISGPGCPVCVSDQSFIDKAIIFAKEKNTIIATFGDMLRVPGTSSSLEKERANGAKINLVYSITDALDLAKTNPDKKIVFLAVGFETTIPTIACGILEAEKQKLNNFFILSSLKLIPPALKNIVLDKEVKIDGFLCPGHVSAVIGTKPYQFIVNRYKIPCVISGFEALDILEAIFLLLRQVVKNKAKVENQYQRVVRKEGNPIAQKLTYKVFKKATVPWRGLGKISQSGLVLKDKYRKFDIEKNIKINFKPRLNRLNSKCICADILKGKNSPGDCRSFASICKPENPLGPCMVSIEGTCNIYYRFGKN
ncbi:MAG: hydrogenase formation protein HypD [Candidatus Omnitrophota bacterium]